MSYIEKNLKEVQSNILRALEKSGRDKSEVKLLAVTKTVDIPRMKEVFDLGVIEFGENKVQEINWKYDEIKGVKWHLIGHLQTNKVKYIIDKVEMIHSVDSLKLGEEISKRALACDRVMDILVEINIANEESKHGVRLDEAEKLAVDLSKLKGIKVKGLMCVAPFVENPQKNRCYFQQMKKLFVDIKAKNYDNIDMEFLSMGMTNDYEVAIEEGANIVRVGTGLFGARNYN